ncbi:MAG: adenylate kinase family protein [Methanomicrobiaceae archaeon]|nr:adenylate kinase family protein [Methanomicrobiaceae archaeon]
MMWGITGTPGTGKSSLADELAARGYPVLHLSETTAPYIIEQDAARQTAVIDEERWVAKLSPFAGFVEGHLAHLLPCDRVVVLRCRPDVLALRLGKRRYPPEKIRENLEAEALDGILIEALEEHPPEHVLELDTTYRSISETADRIEDFIHEKLPPSHGTTDWSEFLEHMV